MSACSECARRAWLVAALCGNLEIAWRSRRSPRDTLSLSNDALIDALAGTDREAIDHAVRRPRPHATARRLAGRWRHRSLPARRSCYPARLRALADAPAVLFCAGDVRRLELGGGDGRGRPARRRGRGHAQTAARRRRARAVARTWPGRGGSDRGERDGDGHRQCGPQRRTGGRRPDDRRSRVRSRVRVPAQQGRPAPAVWWPRSW